MKESLNNLLSKLSQSFEMGQGGFSSRKLTAFVIIILVIIAHIKWLWAGDFSQLEMVLTIDYAFIAALFGMTTYSGLKKNE